MTVWHKLEPSFSSDGQWIVFEADTDAQDDEMQQGSIFKVRSDGTELTKLTDGPAGGTDDRQPNWSPTNESILFQRREPVTVMVSLDAGIFTGAEADWWLASVSPSGIIKTFDFSTMDFRSEIAPTLQGSLTSFQPLVLSSLSSLGAGNHAFYFGIDLNRNGQLDAENLFYNSVNVNVGVSEIDIRPIGSDKARTVYNQAYQENFEEDKIADIIQHARNAYVLIDLFQEGIAASILDIKANGNEIGGYISIGTGENWRADFSQLQPYLVTKQWGQWE